MATVSNLACTPSPVPSGTPGVVTVQFATSPGTPDQTDTITVTKDGVKQGSSVTVTLKGQPAEAIPVLSIGATGKGWEIQDTLGKLAATATANTFDIPN